MAPNLSTESRRDFIRKSALLTLAACYPLSALPDELKSVPMGVVIHSYGIRYGSEIPSTLYPGFADSLDLLRHCHAIGAGGIQTTVRGWGDEFTKKIREERERLDMYLEGSIGLPRDGEDTDRFEKEIRTAKEAGARVVRTVCLNGRRYENFDSMAEWRKFKERSIQSIQYAEPIMRKHQIRLAIENHKDWTSEELAELMDTIGSEWIGVTLDFGNNVSLLEQPMDVIHRLAPYVFSTHVKDMGIKLHESGFLLSEVPLGAGIVDLKEAIALCTRYNPDVTFSLEMITRDPLQIPCLEDHYWHTFETDRSKALEEMIGILGTNSYPSELPKIAGLTPEQKLAFEEENVLQCLAYSQKELIK